MTAQDRFERMLAHDVGPWLGRRGFKRTRGTFHRSAEGGWEIVNFQRHRRSSAASVPFTVNLGVEPGPLITGDEPWGSRGWPLEYECSFRQRLWSLTDSGDRDRWRTIRSWMPALLVTRRVIRDLEATGLPWLEERSDPERAVKSDDGPMPLGNAAARERLRNGLR